MLRDSVEIDEQKYPLHVRQLRVRPDSGGAGQWRGAPGTVLEYGPSGATMTAYYGTEGNVNPPRGAVGGGSAAPSEPYVLTPGGEEAGAPLIGSIALEPGELLGHRLSGGGGYGDPLLRPADRVREDVLAGFVSFAAARDDYGVVFVEEVFSEALEVDATATSALRAGR